MTPKEKLQKAIRLVKEVSKELDKLSDDVKALLPTCDRFIPLKEIKSVTKICQFCNGTGNMTGYIYYCCAACNGRGTVEGLSD